MNYINEFCAERGLSKKELAKRMKYYSVSVDPPTISRFVNGHCLPNAVTLEAMERVLQADRLDLYDFDDLDLLDGRIRQDGPAKRRDHHKPSVRKCYRVSPTFAASIPEDVLEVCGYSDWTAWHYAALKKLLGEYAARKKHMKKVSK